MSKPRHKWSLPGTTYRIKDNKKETVFSELGSLLSSGLDFSRSFGLLIESESDHGMKTVLKELLNNVVGGTLLWQAMEASGRFSRLDCGVVRIGEETGKLKESLDFLGDYYRKTAARNRMVGAAVRYPLIVLCTAVVVVVFMMAVIVPMFEQVYSRMGGELPGLTRWIISVSKAMPFYGTVILLALLSASGLLYHFRNHDKVRAALSSIVLRTPVAGDIVRKTKQSHMCKLLDLLTSSGVPLLYGIEMMKSVITFYPYQASFGTMADRLRNGESFSGSLGLYPALYDKKLVSLIRVGEETNRLPEMFRRQSEELARETEFRLQKLGSLLEPLLVLFVGILVAVILISMYMPMFKLGGIMS